MLLENMYIYFLFIHSFFFARSRSLQWKIKMNVEVMFKIFVCVIWAFACNMMRKHYSYNIYSFSLFSSLYHFFFLANVDVCLYAMTIFQSVFHIFFVVVVVLVLFYKGHRTWKASKLIQRISGKKAQHKIVHTHPASGWASERQSDDETDWIKENLRLI